jgi:hypothetical protein
MGFFSMLLFNKLFFIHNECSIKFDKDSQEYKKCKELQEFNNILFQNFIEKNQLLLSQYIKLLEDFNNQKFLMEMYFIQKKIDNEINQYISQDEQIEFLKEFFKFEDMINEFDINR